VSLTLTDAEIAVLCGDMEHAPACRYDYTAHEPVSCYEDDDGRMWEDDICATPFVAPECTCGYFALLESARVKLRAMRSAP
jgi:hypothetical protein